MEEVGGDLLGALHAAEHALISVLPLLAMCDRWDIGGLSTNIHPQTLRPTVFVYDGHAGGVGIAQRGHDRFAELVASAARVVGDCRCRDGCPSCVQSPKCGNLNEMLDKGAAARLLGAMAPLRPRPPRASAGAERRSAARTWLAHRQRPEVQERVLRRRAQPLALGAVGAPAAPRRAAAAGRPAAPRTRPRTPRARGRADARRPPRPCRSPRTATGAVEPVHVAQQQHVAIGGADRGERGVRGQRHAVADAAEVVLAGRAGARRASSSKQPSRISVYSHSAGCDGSALPSRSRQPIGERADQAALAVAAGRRACARRRRRAASRSAPRASRRPRPPCPRRYRLRRRTFSTVIRPTPPTTYGAAACARSRARRLASWTAVPSSFTVPTRRSRAACASARLRSVSLAHAMSRFFLELVDRRLGLDDRLVGRRHAGLAHGAHARAARAPARSGASTPPTIRRRGPAAARRGPARRSRRTGMRAAPAARTGSRWR